MFVRIPGAKGTSVDLAPLAISSAASEKRTIPSSFLMELPRGEMIWSTGGGRPRLGQVLVVRRIHRARPSTTMLPDRIVCGALRAVAKGTGSELTRKKPAKDKGVRCLSPFFNGG